MPGWFWWVLGACVGWIAFVFGVAGVLGWLHRHQPDPYGEDEE